jgi:hypothetical protein
MNQSDGVGDAYTGPEARLLILGEPDDSGDAAEWPEYREFGLGEANVPDLIRMATDPRLNRAAPDSAEVWAPLHAWRALAQLGATEAAEPLIRLVTRLPNDDWASDEIPVVMGMLGADSLPALTRCLNDESDPSLNRIPAVTAIERIGAMHPDRREDCIVALRHQLARHRDRPAYLNGFIVTALVDLKATEEIDLIREAFADDDVDLSIMGDIEDVEIEFGLRAERTTPRHNPFAELLARTVRGDRSNASLPHQPRHVRKVGRNDPCPCGSGKKYKRCCGARQ